MPTPRGITDANIPGWALKLLIPLIGVFGLWILNQMKEDNKDLKEGMKTLIEQNGTLKAKMILIESNQTDMKKDMETKYGDHERRLRELELKDARREGNGK